MLRVLIFCTVASTVLHWTSAAPTPEEARAKFLEEHANQPGYGYLKRIAIEEKRKKAVQRKTVSVQDPPEVLKRVQELEENGAPKEAEARSILRANEPLVPFLYQGDILLSEDQAIRLNFTKSLKQNRAGGFNKAADGSIIGPVVKWPRGTPICYRFKQGSDPPTMEVARQAFRFWTENTCLAWQENCASQPVIAIHTDGTGCYTTVGRAAGRAEQEMSLQAVGCTFFATAAHEASHVMGMFHEQSRPDRDSYIDVVWSSITARWRSQYNKADGSQTYAIPYDYGSNMQYSGYVSGNAEMLAKEKMYQHTMGNKYGPIFNDLKFVNTYNDCMCKGGIACQNGGFPHPRQCTSKCICPEGFGGATCAERPAGCGATVVATANWQTLQVSVSAAGAGAIRQSCCTWWIKGNGRKLDIQLNSVTPNDCYNDCFLGGTEIKFGDLTRGGARVCCATHAKEFGAVSTTQDMAIVRVCSMRSAQAAVIWFKTK